MRFCAKCHFGLHALPQKWFKTTAIVLFSISVIISLLLIINPLTYYSSYLGFYSSIKGDFSQYVVGWPSGYGVKEAVNWLKKEAKDKPLFVFLRLNSGNPDDALIVYLRKEKNVKIIPVIYLDDILKQIKEVKMTKVSLYYISRGNQLANLENRLSEKIRFKKPLDDEYVGIYSIQP